MQLLRDVAKRCPTFALRRADERLINAEYIG
jgi:hypothetical protein